MSSSLVKQFSRKASNQAKRYVSTKAQKIQSDPLTLKPTAAQQMPEFSNFTQAKSYFGNKILAGNKDLKEVYVAKESMVQSFREIFPEIAHARGITNIRDHHFKSWDENTKVLIEVDNEESDPSHKADSQTMLFATGGPSTLSGSILHKHRYPQDQVLHAVTNRFDSNHDGSAFYFHERDAFPVYIKKVNRGFYCVYIDLYKRLIGNTRLLNEALTNRHHVKISLNWGNIKWQYIPTIFIPNTWHMIMDVYVKRPKYTITRNSVEHAKVSHKIVDTISQKSEDLVVSDMIIRGHHRACYVNFAGSDDPDEHFAWLNRYTSLPHHHIDHSAYGEQVDKVINFPNDGCLSPWIVENLRAEMERLGIAQQYNSRVEKFLVKEQGDRSLKVTKVVWRDTTTNAVHVTRVEKLMFSFGPGVKLFVQPPKYSLVQHIKDVFADKKTSTYAPTVASFVRHLANKINSLMFHNQVFKDFMWAAGSTSVLMIGVDTSKTTPERLAIFQRFQDGINQHWTLIAQRDVSIQGKVYRFFAMQMTGGGNFPSRHVRPDYFVNLLTTTELIFGLNRDDIIGYDIIQGRGCGRAVSGKNAIAFSPISKNAIGSYALGGIGMTTLFPNGELMTQMLEFLAGNGPGDLKNGVIGNTNAHKALYGTEDNVLKGINYGKFVDDTRVVPRLLGLDDSFSFIEASSYAFVLVCVMATAYFIWFYKKKSVQLEPQLSM